MGLRTVLVPCKPGFWGQSWSWDINNFALWNFLDPFPFSLIFFFFLLFPQHPSFLPLCSVFFFFLAEVSGSALDVPLSSFIHSSNIYPVPIVYWALCETQSTKSIAQDIALLT